MKRWLTRLVVLLLLGAIVNVAVAWGCALWSSFRLPSDLQQQRVLEMLQERQFFPQPGDSYGGQAVDGIGLTWLEFHFEPKRHEGTSDINQREVVWAVATLTGLPMRSLQAEIRGTGLDLSEIVNSFHVIDGIRFDERSREQDQFLPYVFPLRPLWTGFAINTLFYATILWLLTFGPFAVRRFVRNKRGRCIKCGYDLGHADHRACPECGAAA